MFSSGVLTKTRSDLKWPTASKKRPETNYNKQETTWTYLQRAKQKTRSNQKWANFEIILQYGATFHCNRSSFVSWRTMVKIELHTLVIVSYIIVRIYFRITCGWLWYSQISTCGKKVNHMDKAWHTNEILTSDWKTTESRLCFAFQIELTGFQICWD